jgi:hypothetical protein
LPLSIFGLYYPCGVDLSGQPQQPQNYFPDRYLGDSLPPEVKMGSMYLLMRAKAITLLHLLRR